jgi:hypothetical protein
MNSTNALLKLAKQGNTEAIATLLNHKLQPKGITAKVSTKNGCLQILLESAQVPPQQALITAISKWITNLDADSLQKVSIYGKQPNDDFIAWSEEIDLKNNSPDPEDLKPSPLPEPITTQSKLPEPITTQSEIPNALKKTMTLKERAKQGDLEAISILLNNATKGKAIAASAFDLQGDCLSIKLEANQVPDRTLMFELIRTQIEYIANDSIKSVKIFAHKAGSELPDWIEIITRSDAIPFDWNKVIDSIKKERWLLGGIAIGITAIAIIGIVFRLTNNTHRIHGGISVPIKEDYAFNTEKGQVCDNLLSIGYRDFHGGAQVTVKDEKSATVGVGTLTEGKAENFSNNKFVCFFTFSITSVPDSSFYSISVGRDQRGAITYSRDDLKAKDWFVDLNIGD